MAIGVCEISSHGTDRERQIGPSAPSRIVAEEHEVVVVGAGAAGLACAQRLAESGVDYVVLEASDHLGGRILTSRAFDATRPFEIGALMIHGKRVVTHTWMRELGLHARPLPTTRRARFSLDGRLLALPLPSNLLHRTIGLRAFYQGAFTLPKRILAYDGPDLSLAEWLERQDALPGAKMLVRLLYAHASAANADTVGILGPAEESVLAGEEFGYTNFQVVEGYDTLVARRAGPLRERILLRTRVTSIRSSGRGARIDFQAADGQEGDLRARRVVVTLPLGVLKSDLVTFDPPLPESKRDAIRALGFGDAMVVLLRFRGGNLADRLGDFGLLWGDGPTSFHRPYVASRAPPNVLDGFTVGREAHRRAGLPDREVVDLTLADLRAILPPSFHPGEVEASVCSRWPVDPFTRGGYSFLPAGASLQHRRDLAEPVGGVLFFAGEATHTRGEAATVHGAIETGYRAANEVIASLRPP